MKLFGRWAHFFIFSITRKYIVIFLSKSWLSQNLIENSDPSLSSGPSATLDYVTIFFEFDRWSKTVIFKLSQDDMTTPRRHEGRVMWNRKIDESQAMHSVTWRENSSEAHTHKHHKTDQSDDYVRVCLIE